MQRVPKGSDGSMPLEKLIQRMKEEFPEEQPKYYGYARWQHVLHESGVFQLLPKSEDGRRTPARVKLKGVKGG